MQSGVLREFFGRAAIESVDQEKPSKSGARLVSSIKPARFVFAVGTASIILAVVTWARAQPSLFVLCAHRKMKFRQSLVIKNKDKFPSVGHRLWLRSRGDGAAWLRSCKPAARGRRRLHARDRPHQTDKSIGSVDRGRHGGVNLSWPSDR